MMNSISILSQACVRRCIAHRPALCVSSQIPQAKQQPQRRNLSQTTSTPSSLSTETPGSNQPHTSPLPPPELLSKTPTTPAPTQAQGQQTLLTGTVSRTGTMQSCIQITHLSQKYDKHLQKHYTRPNRLLVHDPNPQGYLREGDIIQYSTWTSDEKATRLQRKQENIARIQAAAQEALQSGKKHRQGRRFMTAKKRTGNHGTGAEKWVGPRYVFRRVVTPFGTGLDSRMEEVVRAAEAKKLDDLASPLGRRKKGGSSQNVSSSEVSG